MNILNNEESPINSDYDLLTKLGNLGFYKSCEVTTIFLFDRASKQAYNYFSIFVFEEREVESHKVEYLTGKITSISTEYSIGICRYHLTIDDARDSFTQIQNSSVLSNIGGDLKIGELSLINKQFIPKDGTKEVYLNKCLKNNFINGSYIYEFFDTHKNFIEILTKQQREKISDLVIKYLPINLHVLQDRIGNIIFQFPATLISLKSIPNKDDTSLDITLSTDKRIKDKNRYSILVMNEFDDCITGIKYHNSQNNVKARLDIGDTGNQIKTIVYDNETDLVVYESNYTLMKHMYGRLQIGSEFPENRTIITQNEEVQVDVKPVQFLGIPYKKSGHKKYWKEFVEERQYKERLQELQHAMKFIQYGTGQNSEGDKALEDVRKLIIMNSEDQIMLWDPYLSAEDILNTLYYSNQMGVKMRAITSSGSETRKINGEKEQDAADWIKEQRNILNSNSNNYGINLQVRCQYEEFGWKFHDRFLLFVMRDGTARVWSLGTSINSLGKNHHIIQEVSHPQYIVDAFNALWDELKDERCLLWKNK